MTPELTLEKAKKEATAKVRVHRASDFLTSDEIEATRLSNSKGRKKAAFDQIDAYIAEIIARFGYETYKAWDRGEISMENMAKYVRAERHREQTAQYELEALILAAVAGANNPAKGGHAPKSLRIAGKMVQNKQKQLKGAR